MVSWSDVKHPQADIGGSPQGGNKQRKAKNGVDDKHHRMDGNAEDLVRLAQDREPWRIMTANLLKEDGT